MIEQILTGFDPLLGKLRVEQLRSIAKTWVDQPPTKKDDLVRAIARAYASPARVRQVVDALLPEERALLVLLERAGGDAEPMSLLLLLRAAGFEISSVGSYQPNQPLIMQMLEKGLILTNSPYNPGEMQGYYANRIFSDQRILAHTTDFAPITLEIEPVKPPEQRKARRPRAITLDILAFVQAVAGMGGLQINKNRSVRQGDLRKLAKALGWGEGSGQFDGVSFYAPTIALTEALIVLNVLITQGDRLVLNQGERFATMPIAELSAMLLAAYANLPSWTESHREYWDAGLSDYYCTMRSALITLLDSLPVKAGEHDGFYTLEQIREHLFQRIGRHYSLSGPVHQPFIHTRGGREPKVEGKNAEDWEARTRKNWNTHEAPWVGDALASWFFFLGLIELGIENGRFVALRLTDLGHHVLHPTRAPRPLELAAPSGPAWLVQPDFEVMAYLEQATPAQLALLEQIGERIQAQSHIARYRLTRDSVYRALERGVAIDTILDGLSAGSGMPLPQNVTASMREWAGLRERLTLRRRAALIEYPTQLDRNAALSAGIRGRPIGDRLVLLDHGPLPTLRDKYTILDYTLPPPRTLAVTEDGVVMLARGTPDLLAPHLLDRWAERTSPVSWRFTAARMRAAAGRGGAGVAGLIDQLDARLVNRLPALLPFTLRAWAGERTPAELGSVTTLQLADSALADALIDSATFAPLLGARLGPTTILVTRDNMEALRQLLSEIGIAADPPTAV